MWEMRHQNFGKKVDFFFIIKLLLSGNEMERCCAVFMRNRPKPDSGRNPAKRRLLVPVSTGATGTALRLSVKFELR